MLLLMPNVPSPLTTLYLWEEIERIGRDQLVICSLNQCFMAATHHHKEAVRLLCDAPPDAPPESQVPLDFMMMRWLPDSLAEAQRHCADLSVKLVANAVLVRRIAYLANSGLTERDKKPKPCSQVIW